MVLNLPGEDGMLLGQRGSSSRLKDEVIFIRQPRSATVIVATDGTGDTDSIQEGINLVPAGGGVVYIKAGTYKILSPILISRDNVSIVGDGKGTIIETTTDIEVISIATNVNYVFIRDIKIWGSGAGNGSNNGISHNIGFQIRIQNCYIENCGGHAIKGIRSFDMDIANNYINANAGDGINLFRGISILIQGNKIYNNGGDGIQLDGVGGDDQLAHAIITGNHVAVNAGWAVVMSANVNESIIISNIWYSNTSGTISDASTLPLIDHNISGVYPP